MEKLVTYTVIMPVWVFDQYVDKFEIEVEAEGLQDAIEKAKKEVLDNVYMEISSCVRKDKKE